MIDPGAIHCLITARRMFSTETRKRSRLPADAAEDPLPINHSAHAALALVYLDLSLAPGHPRRSRAQRPIASRQKPVTEAHCSHSQLALLQPVREPLPDEDHEDQEGLKGGLKERAHDQRGGPATLPLSCFLTATSLSHQNLLLLRSGRRPSPYG